MVEQRSPKPPVWVRFLLPLPFSYFAEGYRSGHNGAVLKTVRAQVHGGSNPSPSASILFTMAAVAKWLTHRIVAPTFVGSIPIGRPIEGP
jgi:hypothetical protein